MTSDMLSQEEMTEEADPEAVEDTEDFFDIFDDQQDEDGMLETEALETDEDTPSETVDVLGELEDEVEPDTETDLTEELDKIDQELDEQE